MPQAEPLLQVKGLSKSFSTRRGVLDALRSRSRPAVVAVDGVSFELRAHQALGIVGESGSGKSTLARCLVRLLRPDSGSVSFGSIEVTTARGRELAGIRRAMQLIYQDPYSSLNPLMTVGHAISEPATVHHLITRRERHTYTAELLQMVGLSGSVAARRPAELSGGQRQRVAIARAMATRPQLLIADEPVSALDVSIQAQILNVFDRLRREEGVGIVLIAHQLPVVRHLTDTIAVMYLGRLVESGPTERVFSDPRHPYTAALLQSQPGRHRRGRDKQPALQGEMASPLNLPSGCRFRTRCPVAQPICSRVDPAPVAIDRLHTAWCHLAAR